MIRYLYLITLFGTLAWFTTSCNRKNENPNQMIAGTNSKTWHPEKQKNSSGEKEPLTNEEKKETWVFYANGTTSMNLVNEAMQGTWNYDPGSKTLTITPNGQTTSRSFTVSDLTDSKMVLKAPDGSELKLEVND